MAIGRLITRTVGDSFSGLPPHATPSSPARVLIWLERTLLVIGIVLIGYYGYMSAETYLYQQLENRELDAILASAPSAKDHVPVSPPPRLRPSPGSPVGRIEIPRLGVSAVIRAGSDARTLRLAVGHIPGTALPGETGNIGLAGHRDTFFRRLRDIRPSDEIRVVTTTGTFVFSVAKTQIVMPQDTWVLDPTATPTLTLVTCYPFTYIGSAPQRFIVHAVEMPDAAPAAATRVAGVAPVQQEAGIYNGTELNTKAVRRSVSNDSRSVQSERRRRQNHDSRQRLRRPGPKRPIGTAGRSRGRDERVDLPRRPSRRIAAVRR
jgi:sortase A